MEINYEIIGIRVKKIRNEKGMTQEELAEKSHLSTVYIGYVENAKRQVGLSALMSIANELDVGTDYLLGNQGFYEIDGVELFTGCSEIQTEIIIAIIKTIKNFLSENNL